MRLRFFASVLLHTLSLMMLAFAFSSQVNAVVNSATVDGTETPPVDDPGFYNVGVMSGGSGVYLGNGWVLTANHISGTDITLAGVTYHSSGTSIKIGEADMRLFRLTALPALPSLQITATNLALGADIVMIGAGRQRAESQSVWWQHREHNNWTEVEPDDPTLWWQRTGFKTVNEPATVRWGTNQVSGYGSGENEGSFFTTFTSGGTATQYEAQGVRQDSGGAAFYKDESGQWQLAGLMFAVGQYTDQPGGTDTAMFGNHTYFVDLAQYRDEILAIIPEPWQTSIVFGASVWVLLFWRRQQR